VMQPLCLISIKNRINRKETACSVNNSMFHSASCRPYSGESGVRRLSEMGV
jgi:hypothetical protein